MFLLNCNDDFLNKSISSLLIQKNIFHTLEKDKNSFFVLDIFQSQNEIEFRGPFKILKTKTPTTINFLVKNLLDLISDFTLEIKGAKFYPLKQSIVYENKETNLGNIQFIIFSQLVLNKDGLNKIDLYKSIWPSDKDFQLNKLDTHLTNLKNHLKEKINYEFIFSTQSGLIKISID